MLASSSEVNPGHALVVPKLEPLEELRHAMAAHQEVLLERLSRSVSHSFIYIIFVFFSSFYLHRFQSHFVQTVFSTCFGFV